MDGGAKEATATTSYTAHKEPETTTCSTMFHRRPTIRDIEEAESPCRPPATPMQQRPVPSSREDESSCGCGWFIDVPSDEDPWSSYSGGDDASYSPSRHHFLDECRMCGKYLAGDMDIYMYKGDTPFCSEECREEQIRIDEAAQLRKRRRWQKQQHEVVEKSRAANSTASAAVAVVAV